MVWPTFRENVTQCLRFIYWDNSSRGKFKDWLSAEQSLLKPKQNTENISVKILNTKLRTQRVLI